MSEQYTFQAEIQQLLDIVVHSLYTDREIFVRELVSNAADALEKLRFLQASGQTVCEGDTPLKISVTTDDQAHTLTITDSGVGMTKQELMENLGTIARSGSKNFLKQFLQAREQNAEATSQSAQLIGQFGVGFYSAFMVAERVRVLSRSFQEPERKGWCWSSDGGGQYELEEVDGLERGTKIIVQLRQDQTEFARQARIEDILKRHSNFVPFTLELNGTTVNTIQALWTKNKADVTEEQYQEFYRFISRDPAEPFYRLHFTADAPLSIQALLFLQGRSLERYGVQRDESDVHLYSRKVLIEPKSKKLFPEWMRFLRGVVDSEDVPLNISRETTQDSALMQKLNRVLTTRVLKMLEEQLHADAEKYDKFFAEFGHCLKEGIITDPTHRDALQKLMRFESSMLEKGKRTTFDDYLSRMKPEQKEIYFLVASDRETAESSPYFEVFRSNGLEVLFLYDARDEFVMDTYRVIGDKRLRSADKADVTLENQASSTLSEDEVRQLTNWIKETLGDRVDEVRVSKRLVDTPVALQQSDDYLSNSMRRVLKSVGDEHAQTMAGKPHLEINPRHALMVRLSQARTTQAETAVQVVEQLWDHALLSAGLMEQPASMLKRMNGLLEKALS